MDKPSNEPCFSRTELAEILNASPVALIVSREDGTFEYANPALANMLGYDEQEIYNPSVIISHPDDLSVSRNIRNQLINNPQQAITIEKRYLHKSGESLSAQLSMSALTDNKGNIKRFIAQVINISKHKKIETSANLFRSMINSSRESMFIISIETGAILDTNTYGHEILGYSYVEVLMLHIFDIDKNISDKENWNNIISDISKDKNILFDGLYTRKNKKTFDTEVSINYVVLNDIEYALAIARDITERKKTESIIWEQANYDALTKLPNRNMFYEKSQQAIKNAQQSKKKVAVLCLDLDKFKEVNDTLGHDIGDKLLVIAGHRIKQCIRDSDTISRLGGDEFCVTIEHIDKISQINRISNAILSTLSKPFTIDNNKIFISTSIGISIYPDDAKNVDSLLKHSDQAMYSAKEKGRNCFQRFTQSMQKKAIVRMQLSRDLHDTIKNEQFYIEYQPIISFTDNTISKTEALLRWIHPEKGLVPPSEFIPIAEENGIIDDIGDWIFAEAIHNIKHWRKHYMPALQISINASPLYFREGNSQIQNWQKILKKEKLPGQAIVIEITEGLLMETSKKITGKLLTLRDAGIQVALDDFGTGYSSLAYLKKLDIDYLKIDKSFVDNLKPRSHEAALCEAIIIMAHKLKLQVIAEGIETQEQYTLLKSFNCDHGQGFFFSRPIKKADFEQFLQSWNA